MIYLRDIYDHTIQIMDTIESMRDLLSGMLDVYLSVLSNRMNEIVKVLTIFSTIFIPLTFLAGVYGMNFRSFPEIEWRFGYAFFWLISGIRRRDHVALLPTQALAVVDALRPNQ